MRHRVQGVIGRSEYTVIYDDAPDTASLEILTIAFPRLVAPDRGSEPQPVMRATGPVALRLIHWLERDLLPSMSSMSSRLSQDASA